eukprot:c25558_g1_i1.p1 GENE.c25558_g1_i1~~c25558_g1_i1.p1  ORF type:complete len:129 (-),score=26.78 c25558_g1_i1:29-415(-)
MGIYFCPAGMARTKKENKTKAAAECEYETTINLHKSCHKATYKDKAPRAIKMIRKHVTKMLGTEDVRVDVALNRFLWKAGIHSLPTRVRVNIKRQRNAEEDAKDALFCLVTHVPCQNFHGTATVAIKK